MQIILMQIKPVFARDSMADRIAGVGVQHHLGIANRAGREIDQARIIAAGFRSSKFWRCLIDDLVIARPSLASGNIRVRLNQYRHFDRRALVAHLIKFGRTLAVCDEACSLRNLCTELDVLGCQQSGTGNGNSSNLH
jgi:hypothetical protein